VRSSLGLDGKGKEKKRNVLIVILPGEEKKKGLEKARVRNFDLGKKKKKVLPSFHYGREGNGARLEWLRSQEKKEEGDVSGSADLSAYFEGRKKDGRLSKRGGEVEVSLCFT